MATRGRARGTEPPRAPAARAPRLALDLLERRGLLLLQDPKLPSLATLVAGGPFRGSWWGHPKAAEIFRAAGALEDHPDVLVAKLVSEKVTFVHRRLWPALSGVGRARAPWQLDALGKEARALLARLDAESRVRATGKAARELERALLVASQEVHTESGAHALDLMTWEAFAAARSAAPPLPAPEARARLEAVVAELEAEAGAAARLPWEPAHRGGGGRRGRRRGPPTRRSRPRRARPLSAGSARARARSRCFGAR